MPVEQLRTTGERSGQTAAGLLCSQQVIDGAAAKGGGSAAMATYEIDTYHIRLWSSRPTTELNPGIAVAGIYLYEFGPSNAGLMTGGEPTGEEEGLSG
jgi:hypothetical protein